MNYYKKMTEMDDIYNIIGRVLSGEASSDEEENLRRWLEQSKENRELFENMSLAWKGAGLIASPSDESRVLNRVKSRIREEQNAIEKKTKTLPLFGWYRAVASVLLLVALGSLTWFQLADSFSWLNTIGYEVVACEAGQQQDIELTDGSIVYMNGDSKLKYKADFEKTERNVFLQGEAFFKVARNEQKPFVIGLKEAEVKVLGTSFNIKAYPEDQMVETSVLTGKVAFTHRNHFLNSKNDESIHLTPGQKGVIDNFRGSLVSKEVDNQLDIAWMKRELIFENTNLDELTKSLHRMYGVNFKLTDGSLKNLKITAKFENEKIDEVLKILEMTSEFSYKIDENLIVIGKKGEF